MPNKKESKMAVALEACKKLHEVGELDDHLLPVQGSSDSDSADNDETDGSQHKTGTKKRRRYHDIKVMRLSFTHGIVKYLRSKICHGIGKC